MVNAQAYTRITKANMIVATCKKLFDTGEEDTGILENVLVGIICLHFGAGRRYVKEIIEDLVYAEKLQKVGKKLYYREDKGDAQVSANADTGLSARPTRDVLTE